MQREEMCGSFQWFCVLRELISVYVGVRRGHDIVENSESVCWCVSGMKEQPGHVKNWQDLLQRNIDLIALSYLTKNANTLLTCA